jgi:c-di-GMP-related signal transduction protein
MLQLPMEELTPALPLRDEIRSALEGEPRCERFLLTWLEAHEQGDWTRCDAAAQSCPKNTANSAQLAAQYASALLWAAAALSP